MYVYTNADDERLHLIESYNYLVLKNDNISFESAEKGLFSYPFCDKSRQSRDSGLIIMEMR